MKKRLSGCQMGCDLPCIREGCPYWGGVELICDECGCEAETIYNYNGKELCEYCLAEVKHISDKCEECGKQESELQTGVGTDRMEGKENVLFLFLQMDCRKDTPAPPFLVRRMQ